jgi:predicted TIM-barrel fold metal-dependent hydrolase
VGKGEPKARRAHAYGLEADRVGTARNSAPLPTLRFAAARAKEQIMIVDFQHHFTPRELIAQDPGDRLIVHYDESGAPSYTVHRLLYDLDEHIRMMDLAGIDAAFLTSASGMCADLERSRVCNDKAKAAERDYPGRFIGAAHAHPLGGEAGLRELQRCRHELGFPGVVITSEVGGLFLDAPDFEPFWAQAARLGMFVFVHPALKLNHPQQFDGYDTARSVGREFSLIMATIRLINSGVFDRHPELTVHMAHLGGGIASMLGRIRSYQDKDFWGTAGNPRHGMKPAKDFDYYLAHNMVFDSAGFCGAIGAVKTALVEIPASRIVFATDYPQEIRGREVVRDFVKDIAALGRQGEQILSGNVGLLLKDGAAGRRASA